MLPLPLFEKVGHVARLSAAIPCSNLQLAEKKAQLDDWIFEKCAAFDFGPAVKTLLRTTAIAAPITAGGLILVHNVRNETSNVINEAILKGALASAGLAALGLGTYRLLRKESGLSLTAPTLFRALKKLAAVGMLDSLLVGQKKHAALRRINRAYGVRLLADMLNE